MYLPYCLEAVDGHGHVVLNRHYKPVGMRAGQYVDYVPHAVKLKGLTPAVAAKLSHKGHDGLHQVHLYGDGCVPTESPGAWDAYQKRLALLAGLRLE